MQMFALPFLARESGGVSVSCLCFLTQAAAQASGSHLSGVALLQTSQPLRPLHRRRCLEASLRGGCWQPPIMLPMLLLLHPLANCWW